MIHHNLAILAEQISAHYKEREASVSEKYSEKYFDLRSHIFGEMTVAGSTRDEAKKSIDDFEASILAPLIAIIDDFVIESNNVGGLDCNDLVSRMNEAGYYLPEGDE